MAITKTSIINKALTLVGAAPITNIDDDTANARAINRVYEISLRSILSECKWNFATRRALLTTSAETLAWYYTLDNESYIYSKPSDVIRIFGVNDDDATWRDEGDLILSDTQGLGIIYVYYCDDPTKYPASFIEAFVDKLASDVSYIILNSASKAESMLTKYNQVTLPNARAENAQTGKQQTAKDDAWDRARFEDGGTWA